MELFYKEVVIGGTEHVPYEVQPLHSRRRGGRRALIFSEKLYEKLWASYACMSVMLPYPCGLSLRAPMSDSTS